MSKTTIGVRPEVYCYILETLRENLDILLTYIVQQSSIDYTDKNELELALSDAPRSIDGLLFRYIKITRQILKKHRNEIIDEDICKHVRETSIYKKLMEKLNEMKSKYMPKSETVKKS